MSKSVSQQNPGSATAGQLQDQYNAKLSLYRLVLASSFMMKVITRNIFDFCFGFFFPMMPGRMQANMPTKIKYVAYLD